MKKFLLILLPFIFISCVNNKYVKEIKHEVTEDVKEEIEDETEFLEDGKDIEISYKEFLYKKDYEQPRVELEKKIREKDYFDLNDFINFNKLPDNKLKNFIYPKLIYANYYQDNKKFNELIITTKNGNFLPITFSDKGILLKMNVINQNLLINNQIIGINNINNLLENDVAAMDYGNFDYYNIFHDQDNQEYLVRSPFYLPYCYNLNEVISNLEDNFIKGKRSIDICYDIYKSSDYLSDLNSNVIDFIRFQDVVGTKIEDNYQYIYQIKIKIDNQVFGFEELKKIENPYSGVYYTVNGDLLSIYPNNKFILLKYQDQNLVIKYIGSYQINNQEINFNFIDTENGQTQMMSSLKDHITILNMNFKKYNK